MGTTRIHLCLDVKGLLMRWSPAYFRQHWRGAFKHDNGREMTYEEVHAALLDELAQGHERIPIGDCDDFDYKTGCRGHALTPEPRP